MQLRFRPDSLSFTAVAALLLVLSPFPGCAVDVYRGLWVGQVSLNRVNEVTIPLDENNVAIAPKPAVATPTADAAQLRLILHVNGAGQVNLLKDVAILNRVPSTSGDGTEGSGVVNLQESQAALNYQGDLLKNESDMSLVTDERLYPEYPAQAAQRLASAVFDFGDSRATEAVDAVMTAAAIAAANSAANSSQDLTTSAGQQTAIAAARQAALNAASPKVPQADVSKAFSQFLIDHFKSADVDAIATAADPAAQAQTARAEATKLQTNSFYADSRAVDMIDAVVAAATAAGVDETARKLAAQNTTSSYADVSDNYQRFIAGKLFGDMITSAAATAAAEARKSGATAISIDAEVRSDATVGDATAEAIRLKVAQYNDARATEAVEAVLQAIIQSAASSIRNATLSEAEIDSMAQLAGRDALAETVIRYPIQNQNPTLDYDEFVQSDGFQNSAATAAEAAASGAVSERVNNGLFTPQSIEDAAKVAVVKALEGVYSAAARAVRNELPLTGTFALGQGDPRFTWEIEQENLPALDPSTAALSGAILLPANHPTNPFRHRRHPDHTSGFDVMRKLRIDFTGASTNALERAGYGVDRIQGIYREEIFGLHKPLGPNQDMGLRVEGKFTLNRISLIDALNAR